MIMIVVVFHNSFIVERIAVLQARTNNVINERIGNGLTRPKIIDDDVFE